MKIFFEFLLLSFLAYGLNLLIKQLLQKRGNAVTVAIFSFVGAGFLLFLFTPYFIKDTNPSWLFSPMLFLLFIRDLYQAFAKK